jgi:TolA-binding protein
MSFTRSRISLLILGSIALAALSGCATTASTSPKEAVTEHISRFSKVDVTVAAAQGQDEAGQSLTTIQQQVTQKLAPRFTSVTLEKNEKQKGVLGVELKVVDYKRVGGAARLFLGTLPGPDRVSVEGTLFDMANHKKIGTFTGTAEANLGGIVVGDAGIARASAKLGEEIATYLNTNN